MRTLLCALIALCLLLAGCAGGEAANELTAVFFNVGKADAILLSDGEMAVLIDAGENGDGKDVAEAIRARGIERLDLLIITHFDKDHVEEHRRQFVCGLAPGAAGEQQTKRDERAEQFAHACLPGYRRAGGAQDDRRPGKRFRIYKASAAPLS